MMVPRSWVYSEGIFWYIPLVTFLKRPYISSARKGGLKVIVSYSTHPSDQISDFSSYG